MATPAKEVLLIGFGAIGAIYSLILKRSGLARITAVARSNYNVVNSHGIHIRSQKYGDLPGWKPDRLCLSVAQACDRSYSHVVVTTKAIPELTSTPTLLSSLLSPPYSDKYPQPIYVLLQNGLNVEVDLYNAIKKLGKGEPKIISTAVYIATNLAGENVVQHTDYDRVSMGIYRPDCTITTNTVTEELILAEFYNMLEKGGSTVKIVPEIQRVKFIKNLWNVSFSAITTLVGYRLPAIFRAPPKIGEQYEPFVSDATKSYIEEYTIPNIRAILEEALTLARAMGFPDSPDGVPSSAVDHTLQDTAALHTVPNSFHTPSMLLDAKNGRPIEVEVILGEVVRMARRNGVPVPRIEMMYALLVVVQNQILRKLEAARL
ncbi:hypothetical protein PILCRDRAFT_120332 [Piloderma croceum F 1598]|uniref:6-phosphogluconate dehydrogenase C-terminal domain-like protein n=1 Tax=Piloderma croceum (strain F 1598) TaxID=765440 RepID=A0A0C3GP64_PILCF|nr:hypothetical protein PILCRDRAFT_120332 [Piloderma croceum F 1598]